LTVLLPIPSYKNAKNINTLIVDIKTAGQPNVCVEKYRRIESHILPGLWPTANPAVDEVDPPYVVRHIAWVSTWMWYLHNETYCKANNAIPGKSHCFSCTSAGR